MERAWWKRHPAVSRCPVTVRHPVTEERSDFVSCILLRAALLLPNPFPLRTWPDRVTDKRDIFHSEDCSAPQGKVNSDEIQELGQRGVLCSEVVWRGQSWGLPTFQPRLLQHAERCSSWMEGNTDFCHVYKSTSPGTCHGLFLNPSPTAPRFLLAGGPSTISARAGSGKASKSRCF